MENALSAITETGVIGALLVLSIFANAFLFKLLMDSFKDRFSDFKDSSDKQRLLGQSQTDALNSLTRVLDVRNG